MSNKGGQNANLATVSEKRQFGTKNGCVGGLQDPLQFQT